MFSPESIDKLKQNIKCRLSPNRFSHTLGVADMAVRLGEYFLPDSLSELYAAALLHDVAKELNKDEIESFVLEHPGYLSDDDLLSANVIHSLIAPIIIKNDYPEFATDNVLRSVYNHTLACADMDVFSEIIFISDFIEVGRTYKACALVRERLLKGIEKSDSLSDALLCLKRAVYESLDFTVRFIKEKAGFVHPKSILARNSYSSFI